jgi:DEAD/DEAH box helicase domain-containing protein
MAVLDADPEPVPAPVLEPDNPSAGGVGPLELLAELAAAPVRGAAGAAAPSVREVHLRELPARPARHGALARPLSPPLAERLGVQLWSHQAQAVDLARSGRSVVVATGTSSGKTLCFQLPVAEAVSQPIRPGTALALYPTKALAHDQLRAISAPGWPGLRAGAYDGDAGPEERAWIRRSANVVLTNPEMLHCGLLPHHPRWSTFLGRLRYVVIDELHAFRGTFGTHVAHLLRRLRRLAAHYGADPTFICCSATIGSPEQLASELCGVPVEAVTDDGSPRGPRAVAVWQPPPVDEPGGPRVSAHAESATVMSGLIASGRTTIGFCRSRRSTEVVAADVRRRLPGPLARRVRAYRGGYLPEERRAIEDELFGGHLAGVVATSALELGIDVGGLDAVVVDGFPGTVASFWQQAGRAGRGTRASTAVLVAGDDQLDQWLVAHPDELLVRPPEPAVINPSNPFVLDQHLRCAASELPLTHGDERWWPSMLDEGVRRLALAGELVVRHRGRRGEPVAFWDGRGWPSHDVGLRTAAGAPVRIVTADEGRPVGDVDQARAPQQVHRGATYLHQGRNYRVTALDLDAGVATVEPHDGSVYTSPRSETDIRLVATDASRPVGAITAHLGEVEVHTRVIGYQVTDVRTGEVLGREPLDLPRSTLCTRAFWYVISPEVLVAARLGPDAWPGALHAAEHAGIGMLPLFAICDRWDVGGVSIARHPDTGAPTIVVYDASPGGAGIAELGFSVAERHLAATFECISACACADGCPSCVQSPKCGNGNEHLDKAAALALLRSILARDSDRT